MYTEEIINRDKHTEEILDIYIEEIKIGPWDLC